MRRLVVSAAARADIHDVARFTEAHWGKNQKKKYLAVLNAALKRVRRNPEHGRRRIDIDPSLFSLLAGRHVIFYRIFDDHCRVVRITHDRMDAHRLLIDPPSEQF